MNPVDSLKNKQAEASLFTQRQSAYIPFRFPIKASVYCAFGTANAGNMSLLCKTEEDKKILLANRERTKNILGIERFVELNQVHGDCLVDKVDSSVLNKPTLLEADGISSCEENLALSIKTADCQPILITNFDGDFVAALHVGWRGNANNFIIKAIAQLCKCYSVPSNSLLAVRGPSLGPYYSEFIHYKDEWPEEFFSYFCTKTKKIDLWALSKKQFCKAGILEKNIFSIDLCTYGTNPFLYSYRRGAHERQMSFIWRSTNE